MATSRKYHVSPYKPVRVRPQAGAKLMSNVSSDSAGINNFIVKRDWRHNLDRIVRAEGQEWFQPNTGIALGNQPYPNAPATNEAITLLVMARQPNGRTAIVAGTPTTLYRYFALDNGDYYTGNGTPDAYYLETGAGTPYYDSNPGIWIKIGGGFSPFAQRWEWVNINGWLVLNNGVDLPVTYRVEEYAVQPIYELRENGIASVGNITAYKGILMCADVSEIDSKKLTELLSLVSSGATTAGQTGSIGPSLHPATLISGTVTVAGATPTFNAGSVGSIVRFINGAQGVIATVLNTWTVTLSNPPPDINPGLAFFILRPGTADYTVTASTPVFTAAMIGRQLVWPDGTVRTITQYPFFSPTSTQVVVDSNGNIPAGPFSFKNPAAYAPFSDGTYVSRIQYRIINGIPDNPRRWAAVVPADITAGTVSLKFQYPTNSFTPGQVITVLGAGVNGGNLTATMVWLAPDGMNAILDVKAVTTVTGASVQSFDSIGSLVGFVDLQDDGSGIIGMLELEGYLVVYKDTSIWFGQYTGAAGTPVDFGTLIPYRGDKTLYHRNTLIEVDATTSQNSIYGAAQHFHVYAGRSSIYRIDVITRKPVEIPFIEECKDIFFNQASLRIASPANIIPAGTVYPLSSYVFIPLVNGALYYLTMGANDSTVQMGGPFGSFVQPGLFTATSTQAMFSGAPGLPVSASIQPMPLAGVFAADNPITKEVFFCFPDGNGADKALRFDYFNGKVSTTSAAYTAAAAVKKPVVGIQTGPSEDWFIMGQANGTVVRYGLTNTKPTPSGAITATQSGNTLSSSAPIFTTDLVTGRSIQFADRTVVNVTGYVSPTQVTVGGPAMSRLATAFSIISASWHRLGQPYDSVLTSGLECFGTSFGEKALESWLLILASPSPASTVLCEMLGAVNPSQITPALLFSVSLTGPSTRNAIGTLLVQNYFQDRITVSGLNNPEELIERVFNIAGIDSKAFIQR